MQKCRDKCGQINLGLKLGPKWVKSNFFDLKCNQIRPMYDRNNNISICHSTPTISFQVENSLSLKMTLKSSSADDSRLEHQIRWGLFYLRPDSLCYPNALDVWIEGEIKMKIIFEKKETFGFSFKTHRRFDEVNAWLEIETKIDKAPFDTFALILFL